MARPKKDPALKAAASTSGKRKPRASRSKKPEALKWQPAFELSLSARVFFDRVAQAAHELGYIKASDMPALTRYAELLGIWQEAAQVLRPAAEGGEGKYIDTPMTHGEGTMKRLHPAFNVLSRTEQQLQGLEAQFGFTPASRYAILNRLAQGTFRERDEAPGEQSSLGLGEPESPVEFFAAVREAQPVH